MYIFRKIRFSLNQSIGPLNRTGIVPHLPQRNPRPLKINSQSSAAEFTLISRKRSGSLVPTPSGSRYTPIPNHPAMMAVEPRSRQSHSGIKIEENYSSYTSKHGWTQMYPWPHNKWTMWWFFINNLVFFFNLFNLNQKNQSGNSEV